MTDIDYHLFTDSPTLVNAIELLKVRSNRRGFAPVDIRYLFPELGRMCGYAVTAQVETGAHMEGFQLDAFVELYGIVQQTPKPAVIVHHSIGGFAAHCGEVMATFFTRLGAVGLLSDCAVRDLPEVRQLGCPYFVRDSAARHAHFRIARSGVPVQIQGVEVRPGDLIHGDENGFITLPSSEYENIRSPVDRVRPRERRIMDFVRGGDFHLEQFLGMVVQ